jgi:hypothetical protein
MTWAGHMARMGEKNAYRILARKLEEKIPLERPRGRWVDNIKMNLRRIGWDGMEWIRLTWLRISDKWMVLVNTVKNLLVP